MGSKRTVLGWLGVVAMSVLVAVGCKKEESTVSEQDYDEVAANVGSLVAGEEHSAVDGLQLAIGEESGFSASGEGTLTRTYANGTGSIDYSYTLTCQDADGATQTVCSETTTDSARLVLAWDGTWEGQYWDLAVQREGDWTLMDIQSAIATFGGTGSFDVQASGTGLFGREHTLSLDYDAEYSTVQIDTETLRLVGGNITYEVDAERTSTGPRARVDASFHVTAEVTITGPGEATITLDGNRNYTVNVNTGAVSEE